MKITAADSGYVRLVTGTGGEVAHVGRGIGKSKTKTSATEEVDPL